MSRIQPERPRLLSEQRGYGGDLTAILHQLERKRDRAFLKRPPLAS